MKKYYTVYRDIYIRVSHFMEELKLKSIASAQEFKVFAVSQNQAEFLFDKKYGYDMAKRRFPKELEEISFNDIVFVDCKSYFVPDWRRK